MSFVNLTSFNLCQNVYVAFYQVSCSSSSCWLRSKISVHNTKQFVDHVNNFSANSQNILVSFNGFSLFASVSVDKALDLFLEFLSYEALSSSTSLDICEAKHSCSKIGFIIIKKKF